MQFNQQEITVLQSEGLLAPEYLEFYKILGNHDFKSQHILRLAKQGSIVKNYQALQELCAPSSNRSPFIAWLKYAGFSVDQLVSMLSHQGGYNNLAALRKLFIPIANNTGDWFLDFHGQPLTPLTLLAREGVTPERIAYLLNHNGGSKNLNTLQTLLIPMKDMNNKCLIDLSTKQPLTNFSLLVKEGFTYDIIMKILNHNGGSKNVEFLQTLIMPIQNTRVTQLDILTQSGFTIERIIRVLNHGGGTCNIKTLQALLVPMQDEYNNFVVDPMTTQPLTQLNMLISEGFAIEEIIQVTNHDGGTRNLRALQALLAPMKDEHDHWLMNSTTGKPLTQLNILIAAGFTSERIIRVLNNGGGAKNLGTLRALLAPMKDEHNRWLIDPVTQKPLTQLDVLNSAGFTIKRILSALSHIGGSKNIESLQALLVPMEDQSGRRIIDLKTGRPLTQLDVLRSKGFKSNHIIKILGHTGGSKNLEALQALFVSLKNEQHNLLIDPKTGKPLTYLDILHSAGFTNEQITDLLGHNGGVKNLEALQSLFVPMKDVHNNLVINPITAQPLTPLAALISMQFTIAQIIKVLNNIGGSKNLIALQVLFKPTKNLYEQLVLDPLSGRPLTQFNILTAEKFTHNDIINLLGNNGGSKNLCALQALLTPISNINYNNGQPYMQLKILNAAGIENNMVISILSQPGGANSMNELLKLVFCKEISNLMASNAMVCKNIYALANMQAKSGHLNFLTFIKGDVFLKHIQEHPSDLIDLCAKIKKLTTKNLPAIPTSIDTLRQLIQPPGNKRKHADSNQAVTNARSITEHSLFKKPPSPVIGTLNISINTQQF